MSLRNMMARVGLAASIALCAPAAMADGVVGPEAVRELARRYPGAKAYTENGTIEAVYGNLMTPGATPEQAAADFWRDHAAVFGVADPDLRRTLDLSISHGRFRGFQYQQHIDGLPVEGALAYVLVRADTAHRVVYAWADLAATPAGGFAPVAVTADGAAALPRSLPQYADLAVWTDPELVVYAGATPEGDRPAVKAWRFGGSTRRLSPVTRAFTFWVDASTGALLAARDDISYADVTGTVTGIGSQGLRPDVASNPRVPFPIHNGRVQLVGGNSALTDAAGAYTIPHGGTTEVTLTSNFVGPWSVVTDESGAEVSLQVQATPPTAPPMVFNSPSNTPDTAEVNAYVHANLSHEYYKTRGMDILDFALPTAVNVAGACNAFFSSIGGGSISFFVAGGGCPNMAYTTIVAHEYGHFVVFKRGLIQAAFGEGFADSAAIMIYDTPIVGQEFFTTSNLREPGVYVREYPCSGGFHFCGEVLAGAWYRIRSNLGVKHGSELGLEIGRQLHVDWAGMTSGQDTGGQSAHPLTAIEVLTVDDDDGDLGNGTPNYTEICAAFETHKIDCPDLDLLTFSYPQGRPDTFAPGAPGSVLVQVAGIAGQPLSGTGRLFARVNGGSWVESAMAEVSPNLYEASLPTLSCGDHIDYYVGATAVGGLTEFDPALAPAEFYSGFGVTGLTAIHEDRFEENLGWIVSKINLTAGGWEIGDPFDPGPSQSTPEEDFDGSGKCWLTGNSANVDVDGGPTRLSSPIFDLSGRENVVVSYARHHFTSDPSADPFTVDVSTNGGTVWVPIPSETSQSAPGWTQRFFLIDRYAPVNSLFRVRFSTIDNPNNSETESGVDYLRLHQADCSPPCYADCDQSTGAGTLDFFDFVCFQDRFAAGEAYACDCDQSSGTGVCDFFDFVCFQDAFGAGCP